MSTWTLPQFSKWLSTDPLCASTMIYVIIRPYRDIQILSDTLFLQIRLSEHLRPIYFFCICSVRYFPILYYCYFYLSGQQVQLISEFPLTNAAKLKELFAFHFKMGPLEDIPLQHYRMKITSVTPVESSLVPAISLITLFSLMDAEGDRCLLAG